jgi:hypothetical protein
LLHAFNDRNLETYEKLIEDLKTQGQSEISLLDLETILREENLAVLKEPTDVDVLAEEEVAEVEEGTLTMEAVEDIEDSKPVVEVEDIELDEIKPEEIVEEEEEEEDEEEEVAEPVAAKKANVANDMADFVASQIKSDKPLEDLNTMIMGRTRKKIIKKLFSKNENEFLSFVNLVNNQSTWKETSVIIDNEFYERGINPYSKEAIMFSDLIYVRFFPKDRYVGEQ